MASPNENENLPEVAHGASYIEVRDHHHHLPHQQQYQNQQQSQDSWPPLRSTVVSTQPPHPYTKPEDYPSCPQVVAADHQRRHTNKRAPLLGRAPTVVLLWTVIVVLAALVIGLAAGTGIAASKYTSEQTRYQDLQASCSSLAAAATASKTGEAAGGARPSASPNYSRITNGCSDENESTTGTFYTPEFYGKPRFTMYCHKNAPNPPLYSLFTATFTTCMSACASWNAYNASAATPCAAVSFIPLWSDIVAAVRGKAPGDCYLKPGPQSVGKLEEPNIGTECHAAILGGSLNSTSRRL